MTDSNPYIALLKRDLLLAFRSPGQLLNPVLFYLLVLILFPLGIGPESRILQIIGPGIIWVAALLATLLALDTLFRGDFLDGSLEMLALSPRPFALLVAVKIAAHWLLTGLPLLLLTPLLGTFFSLSGHTIGILMLTLLLGTPVLSLIGAIGAALTVGIRGGGALLALVILPLYIPVLIFAAGAVDASVSGLPFSGQLYFLASLLVLAVTLAPPAVAAALRISLN
ncbi:MAG TPA: heme exporter protein CcmB [Gammaproteobacteria bacterium]